MSSDRVAFITGGGTGIGAAIAKRLAASRWRIAINYRNSADQAQATVRACADLGTQAIALHGDVASDIDCRAMVAEAGERFGRLDALVNNAGVTKFCSPQDLEGLSAEDFGRIFSVNVIGMYQMTRAAAEALRRTHGSVLNISSQAGFSGLGSSMAYAASKAAVNNLTLGLARALAPAVRVNALCPSFVNTRWMKRSMDDDEYARMRDDISEIAPLGCMVEPEHVADLAGFVLESRLPMTGELLGVDSGNHLALNTPTFDA